jgi:hypothetical protein
LQKPYAELYEPTTDEATSLQDSLEEILELFQDGNRTLSHLRYVWMALILAIVVKPTVEYYQSDNSIPDETIEEMALWLLRTIKAGIRPETPSVKIIDFMKYSGVSSISSSFSKKLEGFQVLYEALDVYVNAIKTLDEDQSLEALIDILDDCLEGYAIFPGSDGRRNLLSWWLLDVVPATWHLVSPSYVYVVDGLPNREKIVLAQMKTLKAISYAMWFVMIEPQKNKRGLKSQNEVELDVKTYNDFNVGSKLSNREDNAQSIYFVPLKLDTNERTIFDSRVA